MISATKLSRVKEIIHIRMMMLFCIIIMTRDIDMKVSWEFHVHHHLSPTFLQLLVKKTPLILSVSSQDLKVKTCERMPWVQSSPNFFICIFWFLTLVDSRIRLVKLLCGSTSLWFSLIFSFHPSDFSRISGFPDFLCRDLLRLHLHHLAVLFPWLVFARSENLLLYLLWTR